MKSFNSPGDTFWHPDGNWGELFAVKVAFYLDPVRRDTGCLRVIPGSHDPNHFLRKQGLDPKWQAAPSMVQSLDLFGVEPKDFPGNVALESDPGDVVMFNHDLHHSAWGGSARRRMFTMNCTRRGTDERTLGMVKEYLKTKCASGAGVNTGSGLYYLPMWNTAGPERMRHLEQPDQIHDQLHPTFARRAQPV